MGLRNLTRADTDNENSVSEEAVVAAAQALFERTLLPEWDKATTARHWLESAEQYREYARAALIAAMPYLRDR